MKRARVTQSARANVREFLQQESASAVVLVCATATALLWANLAPQSYSDVWSRAVRLGPANWRLDFELATWVADAVMAAFFFVVGLEIKRELTEGELSDPRVAAVPIAAACGGVVVPIVLFFLIAGTGDNSRGWAIPMATDIAFAQAALMLLGNRVERSARLFLLTLAIVDDILAIAVIALFFGKHVSLTWLLAAVATVLGAVALRRARVAWMWPYLLVGAFGWYFTLRAGVHPTISAVAFGLLCPALDPRGRPLPAWSAGSHVDLVAGGYRRKYSLCGTRDDRAVLEVVILREAAGRGGSRHFCDAVAAGDTIHLAGPKNLFRLDESAQHHILIAGGIGITPILAMADRLKALGKPYVLHYAARSRAHMALLARVQRDHGDHLSLHVGEEGTRMRLDALLAGIQGMGLKPFGNLKNKMNNVLGVYIPEHVNGEQIRHDKVHNLFGYNMTRSAGEAFERISPDKRILMFSRSSYIGMHRYGGIWTGDNCSWWSHILLNLKMMPSLNMCGFLYTGADLGGFGANTTRDLLLRWLALGVFTPLMRNHAALGTREQEPYQFEHIEDFRNVIGVRYRLVPYLYSEYMKAALNDDMYFKPLAFVYPDDKLARNTEDQLMIGNEIMIAPVYTQNAIGRYVYLPEEMMFVKFLGNGNMFQEVLPKGIHYVEVALNEVPLFIRKGCAIPVADFAESIPDIKEESIRMVGYEGASYERYTDDGVSRI
jgi:hypothetical protein